MGNLQQEDAANYVVTKIVNTFLKSFNEVDIVTFTHPKDPVVSFGSRGLIGISNSIAKNRITNTPRKHTWIHIIPFYHFPRLNFSH